MCANCYLNEVTIAAGLISIAVPWYKSIWRKLKKGCAWNLKRIN